MRIDVMTLFPKMIEPVLNHSILLRAQEEKHVEINVYDFRNYSDDKHRRVDDTPYGGGAGMVLKVQPVVETLRNIEGSETALKVLMTPQGIPYTHERAETMVQNDHIIILCGHYEGFDERIRDYFDIEISIGDFVLTGGEIAALALIDSMVRLLPDVLHNEASNKDDSFAGGLLEYPHYTRPRVFEGKAVPDVLLSGHHKEIENWRREKALERTKKRRPDLYEKYLKKQDK
ncbi:MAG: tRNA (guanosine(37)-N1)-methyltransferase TrmD [Bacillota bacterium]